SGPASPRPPTASSAASVLLAPAATARSPGACPARPLASPPSGPTGRASPWGRHRSGSRGSAAPAAGPRRGRTPAPPGPPPAGSRPASAGAAHRQAQPDSCGSLLGTHRGGQRPQHALVVLAVGAAGLTQHEHRARPPVETPCPAGVEHVHAEKLDVVADGH